MIWWPSGWIIAVIILLIILIFSNKKIKIFRLKRKYGPGPRNKLFRYIDGSKVYLIRDGKDKRWLKNPETLFELGYDWSDVDDAMPKELDEYIEKNPIST